MTSFDIFVSIVLGLSLFFSLVKGFVREIFSLFSYVGGYLIAVKYQGTFSQILMESIPSKPIAKLISFVAIYIVTAIVISMTGKIIKSILFSGTDLSMFDRLLGGILGLVKGIAILLAITFPLQFFPEVAKKITENSCSAPYLAEDLKFVNQNRESLSLKNNFSNFDIKGAKEKFKELKDLNKLKKRYDGLKEKLPGSEKPLDQYSLDDRKKLEDILKSVDKN
jgi:membrane protein required for colicin V production